MKFLSPTGLESQPFKLKKGHRTLLFTVDELEQLGDELWEISKNYNAEAAKRLGIDIEPEMIDRLAGAPITKE